MEVADFTKRVSDCSSQIAAIKEEMERLIAPLKKKLADTVSEKLREVLASFFDSHPQVKTIYWQQYIPTFNDGEPCEFTVGGVCFSPVEHTEIDSPYFGDNVEDDSKQDFWAYREEDKAFASAMKGVEQFFGSKILEEFLEEAYGQYAFIKVHKDGVEVDNDIEPPY